jgi:hypothetical protein
MHAMASPDFITAPAIRPAAPKAKMTIYFALLIISLVAMLLACLFMYLEIRNYWRDNDNRPIRGKVSQTVVRTILSVERA